MDELEDIKKLSGLGRTTVENITVTAAEKARIQREKNIKPGDLEWFKLWFSRPYWLGWPQEFKQ